jgi:uncharacterized membrane protein
MKRTTVGLSVLAGAALFEAVLVPGVLIGGAAVLAPRFLPRFFGGKRRPAAKKALSSKSLAAVKALTAAPADVKRAVFKTITFRIIATSIDFTSNILVIGDLAAAAGLSAYGLVAGPVFFFAHEMVWGRMGPKGEKIPLTPSSGVKPPLSMKSGFKINHALAKTITYRAIATTTDFSANFYFTRNLTAAAGLTAFAFVVGPFIYYYHEKAWDRFSPAPVSPASASPPLLAPHTAGNARG